MSIPKGTNSNKSIQLFVPFIVCVFITIMSFKIVSKYTSLLMLLLTVFDYCMCNNGNTISTETPGFFLKVTKNVPRLGRRSQPQPQPLSDFDNFFLKTSKSVPRIGRSGGNVSSFNLHKLAFNFQFFQFLFTLGILLIG